VERFHWLGFSIVFPLEVGDLSRLLFLDTFWQCSNVVIVGDFKVLVLATRFGKFCDDDPGLTFILSRLKLQESGLDAAPEREHLGEFGAPVAIFKQGMFGRIYIYIIYILYYNILYIYNIYI
jgi:hypothetical protein